MCWYCVVNVLVEYETLYVKSTRRWSYTFPVLKEISLADITVEQTEVHSYILSHYPISSLTQFASDLNTMNILSKAPIQHLVEFQLIFFSQLTQSK